MTSIAHFILLTSNAIKSSRICVTSAEAFSKVIAQDNLSVLGDGNPGFVNQPNFVSVCSPHEICTINKIHAIQH